MILATVAILAWALAALGLGSLLRLPVPADLRLAAAGFGGLYLLTATALCLHLALPVTPLASALLLAAGLAAFATGGRRLLVESRSDAGGLVAAILPLVAMTPLPSRHYDTGLYHLQAVAWAHAAPVVPGLANLHGRLGLNSAWFPLAALLEAPGLAGRGHVVLNALPLLFLATAILPAIRRVRAGDRSFPTIFLAGTSVAWVLALPRTGSLYPDPAVTVLVVACLALWAREFSAPDEFPGAGRLALALATLALTVKLSAAPLLAGALVLLAPPGRRPSASRLAGAAAVGAALLLPWMARGIASSGCVAYPASWTCIGALPWSVAAGDAARMEATIRWWARSPGVLPEVAQARGAWFAAWLGRLARDPVALAPVLVLLTGLCALAPHARRAPAAVRAPLLVALLGVVSWFALAPDPRFGEGFLLGAGLLGYAWAIADPAARPGDVARPGRRVAMLTGAALLALGAPALAWMLRLRPPDLAPLRWPEIPAPRVRSVRTVSGLDVLVPVGTDQCWAATLPCAPDGADGLSLRGAFAVDPARR